MLVSRSLVGKLLIFSLMLLVAFALVASGKVPDLQLFKDNHAALVAVFHQNPFLFIVGYSCCYLVMITFCLPGVALLTIGAGAIMGTVTGFLVATVASATGALLSALVARYFLRDFIAARFHSQYEKFNENIQTNGVAYLTAVRLTPVVPYFIINILAGVSTFPLKSFYIVSLLGIIPSAIAYANAGTELANLNSLRDVISLRMVMAFTMVALVPLLGIFLFRRLRPKAL